MKPKTFPMYALIQRDYAIFGVGSSESAARKDAAEWLDQDGDMTDGSNSGDLAVVPCTRRLAAYVKKYGTPDSWSTPNGGRDDNGIDLL